MAEAYQEALGPVLLGLAPVLVVAAVVALAFRPVPLSVKTGLEQVAAEEAREEAAGGQDPLREED